MMMPIRIDRGAWVDDRVEVVSLLNNIKASMPQLEALLEECTGHWAYEDFVYRFWRQSYKVFGLQETTETIVAALEALAPNRPLNAWFRSIVANGTGARFRTEHNACWTEVTRPILEAFFHARWFLEMAVQYGKQLPGPPRLMPSGWAALLYLFDLR